MKKIVSLTFLFIILFYGCKKEEPATIPSLSTTPASSITTTSAISGGSIIDDGGASVIANGVCWGINPNPAITDTKTSDGVGTTQFTSSISGLTAGTTYHVRAYATNSVGTAYGADISFLTLGQVPSALTQIPTNITFTGATLNGTVNPNDLSTTVTFEYGTTTSYGSTTTAIQSPVTGNTLVNVSAEITGLLPGTTYHYRVVTVNSIGTTYGEDKTFTTPGQAPTVITQAACCLSSTGVTLNGSVNANGVSSTVSFEYGLNTNYGSTVPALQSPVTGSASTSVSGSVSGLAIGTTYHFRVKAVNSVGTSYGEDKTFTTVGLAPIATTLDATNKTPTGSTLNASVNANNSSTVVTFEYGTTTGYGQTVTASQSPVTGITVTDVSSSITGLTEGATYHFRVKAVNSVGTTYGNDKSFTAPYSPPPTNGLIVYYPFSGNANDASGNGYNGTVTGATLIPNRFGSLNSAYHFNGLHYITTTFPGVLGNADRSISFWAKIETQEYGGIVCSYGGGYGASFNPAVFGTGGNPGGVHLDISNSTVTYEGSNVNNGSWHHFVYIFSTQYGTSLNGVQIFQDGVLLTVLQASYHYGLYNINSTSGAGFRIGEAGYSVQLSIDDVRVYNRVLTNTEILQLLHESGW